MPFLTSADYAPYITSTRLTQITGGDATLLPTLEAKAQQQITDALYERYDTGTIFGQTGTDRNATIIHWMVTIVLYLVWNRIDDKLVPERVSENYREVKDEINRIQEGRKNIQLPQKSVSESGSSVPKTRFRWGSAQPKRKDDNHFV